eukprot:g12695.t1
MMTSVAALAYLYVLYLTVFRRQVEHDASRREINAAQGLGFGANLCANLLAPICVVQVQDEIGGLLDGLMGELEALQKEEMAQAPQIAHDMRTAVHFLNEFSRLAGGPAPGPAPWEGPAVAPQQINAFVAMTSILLDADAVLHGVGRGSSVPMVLRATRQAMNDNSASPAVTLAEAELRICRTGAWRYIEAKLAALLWEIVDHEAMASESRSSCLASYETQHEPRNRTGNGFFLSLNIHRKIDAAVDLIFHNAMWDQWQRLTATPDVDVLEENMRALRIT